MFFVVHVGGLPRDRNRASALNRPAKAAGTWVALRPYLLDIRAQLVNVIPVVTPIILVLAGFPVTFAMQTAMHVLDVISHLVSTC